MNGPERGGVGITLIAWLAALPASIVGEIVARVLFHAELPGWVTFARLALLLVLVALTRASLDLRPLGGYLLALVALTAGGMAVAAIERGAAWTAWTARVSYAAGMVADSLLELIPCLLLALTAIGVGRRNLFLTRGDLRARRPLPFGLPPASSALLGPAPAVFFAGSLALQLILKTPPDPRLLSRPRA